jgi:hypothetical protein
VKGLGLGFRSIENTFYRITGDGGEGAVARVFCCMSVLGGEGIDVRVMGEGIRPIGPVAYVYVYMYIYIYITQ